MNRTAFAISEPGENAWNPQTSPVGVISIDAIELLQPFVPTQGHESPKPHLGSQTAMRGWLPGGGREQAVLTALSLLIADLVALVGAFLGIHLLAAIFVPITTPTHLALDCLELALGYAVVGYLMGLFPATAISPVYELRQLVTASFLSVCLSLIITTSLSPISSIQYLTAFVAGMTGVIVLPLARATSRHFFSRFSWWGERVIVIGTGVQGRAIYNFYRRSIQRGLKPVGFVDQASDNPNTPIADQAAFIDTLHSHAEYLGPLSQLPRIARRYSARWGIIAPGGCDGMDMLDVMNFSGSLPNMIILPSEFSLPSLWASPRECAGVMGIRVRDYLRSPFAMALKRSIDIAGAASGLILASPLFLLAFVWIKLRSPGPVFYGHTRVGMGRNPFKAWKFRTMVPNADEVLEEYLTNDPEMRREWYENQKLKRDPRVISGIGTFLRKSSLDEIPQLWNILTGEMSLVGPRPIVTGEIEKYRQMFPLYLRVRPGLTGLWQISGRNDTSYEQRVRLDSYYVCNWSPWLDVYILLRTFRTIICREGAY